MTVRAATCFSGVGAPECAMPAWSWVWAAEIEPFPAAVLAARHPGSVNLGDVLAPRFDERAKSFGPIDVLVGGPPCQAFSIAGNRGSLTDPRGELSLRWAQIIHAVDPVFAVTENVPGWLNLPDNSFGHFLGALVGADDSLPAPGGQGWPRAGMVAGPLARACWRILDAQYHGVPQRRERVFIVSSARDWSDPSQILFEPKGLRRDTPSRGEAREAVTRPIAAGSPRGSGYRNDADTADNLIASDVAPPLTSNPYGDHESREGLLIAAEVVPPLVSRSSRGGAQTLSMGHNTDCHIVAYDIHGIPATNGATRTDVHTPLRARAPGQSEASTTTVVAYGGNEPIGFTRCDDGSDAALGLAPTLRCGSNFSAHAAVAYGGNDTRGPIEVSTALNAHGGPHGRLDFESETFVAVEPVAYQCQGSNVGEAGTLRSGNGHLTGGVPFVAHAFDARQSDVCQYGDPAAPLDTSGYTQAVAFAENSRAEVRLEGGDGRTVASLKTGGGKPGQSYPAMMQGAAIRRLLPVECERLMGLPDFYTAITYRGKEAADGPRYKAIGNSMAVPVLTWILTRIEAQLAARADGGQEHAA